jgi:hypothetical protein
MHPSAAGIVHEWLSRACLEAACSSTDHGGGNRRAVVVVASLLAHLL